METKPFRIKQPDTILENLKTLGKDFPFAVRKQKISRSHLSEDIRNKEKGINRENYAEQWKEQDST